MAGAVDLSALKRPPAGAPGEGGTDAPVPPGATDITEANFEAEVVARSGEVPVVVLLWTPRSESSVQLAQVLSALVAQDGGRWSLGSVNIDVAPRVAQAFGAQNIPTVVAMAAGQPISSFEGMQDPEQIRRWIDSILEATAGKLAGGPQDEQPEQVDPALAAARTHLDAGDFEAAKAAYQEILNGDPQHTEAQGAVRQIDFLSRASAAQPDAVARADADPADIAAGLEAADIQLLGQDPAGAFDRLIALIKRSAGDDRTAVRTRLLELFELFDPADPTVIAARRNLANALY